MPNPPVYQIFDRAGTRNPCLNIGGQQPHTSIVAEVEDFGYSEIQGVEECTEAVYELSLG